MPAHRLECRLSAGFTANAAGAKVLDVVWPLGCNGAVETTQIRRNGKLVIHKKRVALAHLVQGGDAEDWVADCGKGGEWAAAKLVFVKIRKAQVREVGI